MVVLSQPALDHFSPIKTCNNKPIPVLNSVPIVDLSDPHAMTLLVKVCEEFGFFKLVNHGVPMELMAGLEAQALDFFNSPQSDKERAGPADPFGYGSKRIGPNGDVGWIEYILLNTNPDTDSHKTLSVFRSNPQTFRRAVEDYVGAVKEVTCEVVELIAKGMGMEPQNAISKLLRDEKSHSFFRVNHYPPCPELAALTGRNMVGFGEHTDPQIISVLRSNNTSGLQICLKDGSWVSVPPDHHSFFINVGDALQVITNGRFKSVKHRVLPDHSKSRLSMIYFGGPPLGEKITPFASIMGQGEESLYKEFTWFQYKYSAYKTKLADNRLHQFEKEKKINENN